MKINSGIKDKQLYNDISTIIEKSKAGVAQTVNSALTLLYWKIGQRINSDILNDNRAVYGMLFQRINLSKKPTDTIKKEIYKLESNNKELSPDLFFENPYFLNFLRLKDSYSEKDLEAAILRELEHFISELGT